MLPKIPTKRPTTMGFSSINDKLTAIRSNPSISYRWARPSKSVLISSKEPSETFRLERCKSRMGNKYQATGRCGILLKQNKEASQALLCSMQMFLQEVIHQNIDGEIDTPQLT